MKTTFSRQFAMITALLLLCMIITGVSFRFLLLGTIETENEQSLRADALALANLAEAYEPAGELEDNWDFQIALSLFSKAGNVQALICDLSGTVILCSCGQISCEHLDKSVDAGFLASVETDAVSYEPRADSGVYEDERFLSGALIVSKESNERVGFAVVSAPRTQITQYMEKSTRLFFYTSIVVLMAALIAATFLSRSQVQPLQQIAEAARRYGRGELGTRVEESKRNSEEINDLARAFNTMASSLEKSEQMRQEFVANISHELKTPMTTIGGYIDGMLDGTIPEEKQQHYMQIVSGEVRRLSRLVRNMLNIARLQATGEEEGRKVRFDLRDVMSDVLITFEQKINAKHLQVSVDLPERSLWVKTERDAITQVFYNLIDNAIKFCPNGGSLTLSLRADGSKARACVRNTGPTIAPEELPMLFDRFHKADKSRSADREGWGLGLYIAKTIVSACNGDIWASSENGITSFYFTLPTVR